MILRDRSSADDFEGQVECSRARLSKLPPCLHRFTSSWARALSLTNIWLALHSIISLLSPPAVKVFEFFQHLMQLLSGGQDRGPEMGAPLYLSEALAGNQTNARFLKKGETVFGIAAPER